MLAHTLKTATLLALLGLPLACDSNPTSPTSPSPSPSRPRIETSLLGAFPAPLYSGINVSLAAQQQYGPSATATQICGHLYCWRAVVNGQQYSIDMARAVRDQFGSGYVLGAVGVGIYDWRAVHWSAFTHAVLPVMVIASDYFYNVSAVQTALANFQSTLSATQTWYGAALAPYGALFNPCSGRCYHSFQLLQPLVVFTQSSFSYTAAQWNAFSAEGSSAPFYNGDSPLADLAWNAYATAYPPNDLGGPSGTAVRVLISVFTGNSPTVDGGTGWLSDMVGGTVVRAAFAVTPPIVTSLSCSWGVDGSTLTSPCQEATWFVAHELGYTSGLQSCGYDLNCLRFTIMGYTEPPSATLSLSQATTLAASGFFF